MKILMVGSGGREHALIMKLLESPKVEKIYCAPGNGGISAYAECFDVDACDIEGMLNLAKRLAVDLVFVAPDDPLALGMVDAFEEAGFKTFGPNKAAAQIEASKIFSKNFMKKHNIPTAEYEVFEEYALAEKYIENYDKFPVVLKADGLALGKGVLICQDKKDALEGLKTLMVDRKMGKAGDKIVVEEFLTGPEVSVLAFTDGKTVCPMVSSKDHKRALDNDKGLNTGGMGTIAPNPYYSKEMHEKCFNDIFMPTVDGMRKECQDQKRTEQQDRKHDINRTENRFFLINDHGHGKVDRHIPFGGQIFSDRNQGTDHVFLKIPVKSACDITV